MQWLGDICKNKGWWVDRGEILDQSKAREFLETFSSYFVLDYSDENIWSNYNWLQVELSKYAGKVCVVVNVASKWGKTKANYSQLVELYNKYNKVRDTLATISHSIRQIKFSRQRISWPSSPSPAISSERRSRALTVKSNSSLPASVSSSTCSRRSTSTEPRSITLVHCCSMTRYLPAPPPL